VSSLHHQLSRFIKEYLSRLGQRDAPLISQKEGHAQIFLELADLTAQRRLRDVQLLRRLAEVQVFRDSDKVANVPKFHGGLFYTRWVLLTKFINHEALCRLSAPGVRAV